jgi:ribosomal protein S27AE
MINTCNTPFVYKAIRKSSFISQMRKESRAMDQCPRCGSPNLLEYGDIVECGECHLTFRKRFLDEMDEDEILAEEEKKGFLDAFYDSED